MCFIFLRRWKSKVIKRCMLFNGTCPLWKDLINGKCCVYELFKKFWVFRKIVLTLSFENWAMEVWWYLCYEMQGIMCLCLFKYEVVCGGWSMRYMMLYYGMSRVFCEYACFSYVIYEWRFKQWFLDVEICDILWKCWWKLS